ncbi:MucR family transcriptional regulator [Lactococcus lactis]|uniref:MucR family transcriptional regulator n=1 Tax=Lactococcus lactis TaxID=1358 RepID=UPI0013E8FF53|nr:MucR family transcriptional regulator [Lactococcus lactis]MDM7651160.1 MucR family transcriptional regulator [Lactococcus lactis]
MAKTDKELTAEIVSAYVPSWNISDGTKPMDHNELMQLINDVHSALQKLKD